QHLLTGESQPIERSIGDDVFACTTLQTGRIMVRVKQAGKDTIAGQIARVLDNTVAALDQLMSENEAFVDSLTLPMLAIGGIALSTVGAEGALGVMWNIPGQRMEQFGPLSMLNFLHVASADGILVKDGRSLEGLQSVDTVIFDKTGTLTLEQPEVAA